MEVAPQIFHFETGPFNWYIIRQDGRLTLVYAGFPGHFPVFLSALQSLGHTLKDLEAIVLTHAHADHVGFAEIVRRQTGVPVYVHRDDAEMAKRAFQLPWYGLLSNAWRPYIATMLGTAAANGLFRMQPLEKVQTFTNGDRLEVPGRLLALHTPGHTPGESIFYQELGSVLFAGDTLVTCNLMSGQSIEPNIPSELLNHDTARASRSLEVLRQFDRVTLLSGHGEPWVGTLGIAVDRAIQTVGGRKT